MEVIRKLGDRVEREHDQYLRDSQRIEDRSSTSVNGVSTPPIGGAVDFESLVGGGGANTIRADTTMDSSKGWEDDVWGSLLNDSQVCYTLHNFAQCTHSSIAGSCPESTNCPANAAAAAAGAITTF